MYSSTVLEFGTSLTRNSDRQLLYHWNWNKNILKEEMSTAMSNATLVLSQLQKNFLFHIDSQILSSVVRVQRLTNPLTKDWGKA